MSNENCCFCGKAYKEHALLQHYYTMLRWFCIFETLFSGRVSSGRLKGCSLLQGQPISGAFPVFAGDMESDKCHLSGIIIRDLSCIVSNYRSTKSLDQYLKEQNVLGVASCPHHFPQLRQITACKAPGQLD